MNHTHSALKFLDSYTRDDAEIFFGRDREVNELYARCFESDILLVYGVSGVGKTSVIQCGLSSRFEETDWLPVQVRRSENLLDAWADQIRAQSSTPSSPGASLNKLAQNLYLDEFKPLYFIFDQFEELFLFGTAEEEQQFFEQIRSLQASSLNAKFIIVCREEFLAQFAIGERIIPDLLTNRMRLEHLTAKQMASVLESILRASGRSYDQGFIDEFERIILLDDERIDLSYFQVYLDHVLSKTPTDAVLTLEDVGGIDGLRRVIDHFVIEQLSSLRHPEAGKQLLKFMVSSKGTKVSRGISDFSEIELGLSESEVASLLEDLVNARILTVAANSQKFEMRHDSVAKCIFEMMSEQDSLRWEVEEFVRVAYRRNQLEGAGLTSADLDYIHPMRKSIVLTKEEKTFVDEAFAKRERRRKSRKRIQRISAFLAIPIMIVSSLIVPYRMTQEDFAKSKREESELLANWVLKNNTGDPMMNYLLARKAHENHPTAETHRALIHVFRNRHMAFKSLPYNMLIGENDTSVTLMNTIDSTLIQLGINGTERSLKVPWNPILDSQDVFPQSEKDVPRCHYQPFGRIVLDTNRMTTETFEGISIETMSLQGVAFTELYNKKQDLKGFFMKNGEVYTFDENGCITYHGNAAPPSDQFNGFFILGQDTIRGKMKSSDVRNWFVYEKAGERFVKTPLFSREERGIVLENPHQGAIVAILQSRNQRDKLTVKYFGDGPQPSLTYDIRGKLEPNIWSADRLWFQMLSEYGEFVLWQERREIGPNQTQDLHFFSPKSDSITTLRLSGYDSFRVHPKGFCVHWNPFDINDGIQMPRTQISNVRKPDTKGVSISGRFLQMMDDQVITYSGKDEVHINSTERIEAYDLLTQERQEIPVNEIVFRSLRDRPRTLTHREAFYINEGHDMLLMNWMDAEKKELHLVSLDSTFQPLAFHDMSLTSDRIFFRNSNMLRKSFLLINDFTIMFSGPKQDDYSFRKSSSNCKIPDDCPDVLFEISDGEIRRYVVSADGWELSMKATVPSTDQLGNIEFVDCDGQLIQFSSGHAIFRNRRHEYEALDLTSDTSIWTATPYRFSYLKSKGQVQLIEFNNEIIRDSIVYEYDQFQRRDEILFLKRNDTICTVDLISGKTDTIVQVDFRNKRLDYVSNDFLVFVVAGQGSLFQENFYSYSIVKEAFVDSLVDGRRDNVTSDGGQPVYKHREYSLDYNFGNYGEIEASRYKLTHSLNNVKLDSNGMFTAFELPEFILDFYESEELHLARELRIPGLTSDYAVGKSKKMSFLLSKSEGGVMFKGEPYEKLRVLNDDFFVIESNGVLTLCALSVEAIDEYFRSTYGDIELPNNYKKEFGLR